MKRQNPAGVVLFQHTAPGQRCLSFRCSSVSLLEQNQALPISTHSETVIRPSTPNPQESQRPLHCPAYVSPALLTLQNHGRSRSSSQQQLLKTPRE